MDNELRSLKESLDNTYLKDLEMTKALKKKILKKTSTSRSFRVFPQIKFFASLVAAGLLLVVLGYGFLQPQSTHQADRPSLHEQQVALLAFQRELVSVMELQTTAESYFIAEDLNTRNQETLEKYRGQVVKRGEEVIAGLKKLQIPLMLSSNEREIQQSLNLLVESYEEKNEYYRGLNMESYKNIEKKDVFYYASKGYMKTFYRFENEIGSVYETLKLGGPNFSRLVGINEVNDLKLLSQ